MILVTDYDCTLNPHHENKLINKLEVGRNILALNKFKKQDENNKVIIATKRETDSILDEIEGRFPYDYVISYDGLVCLDKNNDIIFENYLTNEEVNNINLFLYENKDIISESEYFSRGRKILSTEKKLVKIRLYFKNVPENINRIKNGIKKYNLTGIAFDSLGKHKCISFHRPCDKSMAITRLIQENKIKGKVITVGDGDNDQAMIDDFNGYRIRKYATDDNPFSPVTDSVHSLVKTKLRRK